MKQMTKNTIVLMAGIFAVSCSTATPEPLPVEWPQEEIVELEVQENNVPGTVTEPWEEPIINIVDVPAQLDPTGIYYRPAHRVPVEIVPGRVQVEQFPLDADESINQRNSR